jgi:cytochrome c peroxidase
VVRCNSFKDTSDFFKESNRRGFYHDGRFATLMNVVNHYNDCKKLNLAQTEKSDLVEYLKSL